MDKKAVIEALDNLRESSENYSGYLLAGIEASIELIEAMEDEPITAEALEAAGYACLFDKGRGESLWQISKNDHSLRVFIRQHKTLWIAYYKPNEEEPHFMIEKEKASTTKMAHLHALEEMFLS